MIGWRERTVEAPGGALVLFESDDVDRDLDDAIARGGPAPYGRVLWPSASACAAVLLGLLDGRSVLELGCGTGLVSLVAARHGARVLATDVDTGALAAVSAAAAHLDAARSPPKLSTRTFDIRGGEPLPAADIVVAADLLYEEVLAAAMARRALEANARGSVVIVGDPGRVFRKRFDGLIADQHLACAWRSIGDVSVAVIG